MALERLLENTDLVVGQFARCDIQQGWRLNLAEPRSLVLHFVLAGEAELTYNAATRRLQRGMIVMVPPQLAHSLEVGPVREGSEVNSDVNSLPTGTATHINVGEHGPDAFVMACGRVETTYGGMFRTFDAFDDAVIVDLSNESGASALLDIIYAEQLRGDLGSCEMVSALMQQCFIIMLRALRRDGISRIH